MGIETRKDFAVFGFVPCKQHNTKIEGPKATPTTGQREPTCYLFLWEMWLSKVFSTATFLYFLPLPQGYGELRPTFPFGKDKARRRGQTRIISLLSPYFSASFSVSVVFS